MSTLNFPVNPVNGQIYPSNALRGQNVYYWDATYQTWRLTGAATGVIADTYGSSTAIPQFTVDATGSITFATNIDITPSASSVVLDPPINGETNVQTVLENAIYNVASPNLTVVEAAVGNVTITLPDTTVTPGAYQYASFTVDPQGRITAATSGVPPETQTQSPIVNLGTPSMPVIGILASSTTQSGAVQLNNTVTSTATDLALTAAQGSVLQSQINALAIQGGLAFAGTFDAFSRQVITVSLDGAAVGFRVGVNLPDPSPTIQDYFVIVSVPGTYPPPGGGAPLDVNQGDWLFCNGVNWVKFNTGANLPYASTTTPGAVILSTNADTQLGTDATKAVTPASLSSRIANEVIAGIAEVATQTEVDNGVDDTRFVTPLKLKNFITGGLNQGIPATRIEATPPINGQYILQNLLEDAIYDITSNNIDVTEVPTGRVAINLPATGVTAGSYVNPTLTIDTVGRIVAAVDGVSPGSIDVVSPIINVGTTSAPIIGIQASSTSQSGAVQLVNTTSSSAINLALTAAQGKVLQDQINVLSIAGNLSFAGTFDAETAQMLTVTIAGADAGFGVGLDLPPPSVPVTDHFVIVTVPGTYIPPGGSTPLTLGQGAWLFCNGAEWVKVDLASKVPYASETASGVIQLATSAEVQDGQDSTLAVTPAGLSSRSATETRSGLVELATQAEVDAGVDNTRAVTPLTLRNFSANAEASNVSVNPPINGGLNVQDVLENAIYNVASTNLTVTESATGLVDVSMPATGVVGGSYDYASITVDPQGRITTASTNTLPLASTTEQGIVQLVDDTSSTATNLALTAAQGKILQDQINVLSVTGTLSFAGTFDAATAQMVTVTVAGTDAGFVVGSDLPPPSLSVTDHFVIVTTPGTYTPPGGTSALTLGQGAWLFCNGTEWVKVDLASKIPYASESASGVVQLATPSEVQIGLDGTLAVTPAGLSGRTSTETRTGLIEIATQSEVDSGFDDSRAVTPLKLNTLLSNSALTIDSSRVVVNPAINGDVNLQNVLENAIYNVNSSNLTVTEAATGLVSISMPASGVTPGSYDYASLTVDSLGRVLSVSTNTLPVASTTQQGIVQLNDSTSSTSTSLALTAAQGKVLQDQINVLTVAGTIAFSGTFDASTSQMVTVTVVGTNAGFVVGSDLPPPSVAVTDHFVIVTTPGTYTPPGGSTPLTLGQGAWLFCNGTEWVKVDLASKVPYASETASGVVQLATVTEVQDGLDTTLVVTPAGLSGRTSTETRTGLIEIATQPEVDAGVDDTRAITPLKLSSLLSSGTTNISASGVVVNPAINGDLNLQAVLENAIYNVSSTNLTVTEAATGLVTISMPATGVSAGGYNYASITVDAFGRITAASSNTLPVASTTQQGIVQLVNNTTTDDSTQALTAAAGYNLQTQIDNILTTVSPTFAGTLDCSTGLMLSVTPKAQTVGFSAGNPLPAAAPSNNEFFVIVTVAGSYATPGGSSVLTQDGDWFVSNGSAWIYYNVGPVPSYVQFDDVSGSFDGVEVTFNLAIGGSNYAPAPSYNIMVFLGGIAQMPGSSYSIIGNQITFTEAPLAGATFYATTVTSV